MLAVSARVEVVGPPVIKPGSDGTTQRTIGIGLVALGVVAAGVGTFFGLRAISALDESGPHCNDRACDQQGLDLRDRSQTQANVSTVLFVMSGVAVAGGAVLWLTAPRRSSASASPTRGIAVSPMASPSGGSVTAAYRF